MSDASIEILDGKIRLSIARLAQEFGMSRETISRRLAAAKVAPDGKRNGYPVYRLKDAAEALHTDLSIANGMDPTQLRPMERRAWFQSENERLKFEQETGHLILSEEVRSEMSAMVKIVVRFMETLPDTVERDLRCGPEVVEYLLTKTRDIRTEMALAVLEEDAEPLEPTNLQRSP